MFLVLKILKGRHFVMKGKLSYRIFENGTTLKYKFITPDQLDEYKGTWFNEIGLVFRLV